MIRTCTLYADGWGRCGRPARARFLPGWRCEDHTPAKLAGRPETVPDPDRTIAGVRAAWRKRHDEHMAALGVAS